ncbi:MAG: pmtA [candidate division NC10 bacterium]|nr:pmtA [candidate division NC10 bacterium]
METSASFEARSAQLLYPTRSGHRNECTTSPRRREDFTLTSKKRPGPPLVERMGAPVCTRIGFNTELRLKPLLERVALRPDQMRRVNMLNGWRLVRCINPA